MEEKSNKDPELFFQQGIGIGPFQMTHKLGEGQFGDVFLGIHEETNEKVAIKQISKAKIAEKEGVDINTIYNEINIQKILFHPYLCKFYFAIENPDYIFIVTEYCNGGDIYNQLYNMENPFEEVEACKFFSQLLSGLEYMHNNYISHRDIKLENILLDEYKDIKLTDFGLSKRFEENMEFNDRVGSPQYAAPEIFTSNKHKGKIADIWSMGICLYTLVCGDFPFSGNNLNELLKNLIKNNFELPDFVSPQFKDLICRILDKNPKTRFTIEQIKNHPWMHIIDFNFMKSPGVIINKDILPIDTDIIKYMSENNETKIRNIISDILTNKHNKNTILYYLNVEILKRNKKESVSDFRPLSNLFLKYIGDKKSKLEFYNNDVNKKIDELTKIVLNEFKMDELRIRQNIKESLNIVKTFSDNTPSNKKISNNINNLNNDNKIKNNDNKNNNKNSLNNKKKGINKINKLRSKTFKFDNFNDFLKKEEEEKKKKQEKEEILKKNKLNLLHQYIGPLLFIHDLIDEIITKAVKSKNKKISKKKLILINSSSLNIIATKVPNNIIEPIKEENTENKETNSPEINIKKVNTFSMYKLEEIIFPSTTKNADKTFSFGFYQPKNKNSVNLNYKNVTEKKNKNNDNKIELTKNHKKLNFANNDKKKEKDKNINDLKNNNKKFEKKKYISHLQRNKSDNFSRIINSSRFPKIIKEFKKNIEKSGILNKNRNKNKRSLSQELKIKKINKLNDEDINKAIKEKKRSNSENIKNIQKILEKEKNEKKVRKNYVNSSITLNTIDETNRIFFAKKIEGKKNKNNDINDNLNINKILSEKRNRKYTEVKKEDYTLISKTGRQPLNRNKKNINMSQDFYDRSYMNTINVDIKKDKKKFKNKINETMTIENNNAQNLKKINGRTLYIKRNKNKTNRKHSIGSNNNDDKDGNILNKTNRNNHKRMQTTPLKMIEKPKKSKDIKSSIFTHKSTKTGFIQTGRNKRNNTLLDKNISTNDSSDKKQINLNENKNKRYKTIKSNSIKLKNALKDLVKGNNDKNDKNNNSNKYELKTRKNETLIRNIIDDCVGRNNTTISNLDKNLLRFSCKVYIDKKKVVFNLNLILEEKGRNILTGEFIDGDIQKYGKIFETIKEKLE